MRTLKKTLSLLLAVALVLSLTVVGASAAYTGNKVDTLKDAADVGADYSEAVGVMVGLGIIEGYDDGTLRPETTYTREQAAKIIAYMQLGPKDADSLRCTKAPFTDVAADRWSAGYIAYCVEQGIIDGMGDGTFQPEAQLTGYQWAKMLLCAVGYGRNDEYVGSSWSLNTAKDALDKGIFDGDLVGADHTPLQRQQAILYAFNALTNEKASVVVYSPSLGDYITKYGDFADRVTYEGTLGWNVYKLASSTGIVVANEGTGADATVLSKDYSTTASSQVIAVSANTGIDMMYHAAKIWHVNGKTAVYVMDLAEVDMYACSHIGEGEAAAKKVNATAKTLGDEGVNYEYAVIDNTAYAAKSYAGVTYKYGLGELGVSPKGKDVTYFTNHNGKYYAIDNADIWTGTDGMEKGDTVIYIVENDVYNMFAVSATTGTMKRISNSDKDITLTDGTVLEKSNLFVGADVTAADVGETFAFVLDTHGDYIAFTKSGIANLYFYTGEWHTSSDFNTWHGEHTYVAQFINVTTGEPVELNVTSAFILNDARTGLRTYGYYDVDVADANGLYNPKVVTEANNLYYGVYAIEDDAIYNASTAYRTVDNWSGRIYLDNPTTFIVATGTGSSVEVETYGSLTEMLSHYPGNAVQFSTTALTVYTTGTDNKACNVVFAYLGNYIATGSNIFLPNNIKAADWNFDVDDGYFYDGFYLNGEKVTLYVDAPEAHDMNRGFYTFQVQNGEWTLTRQTADTYVGIATLRTSTGATWFNVNGTDVPFMADPVVVDLRAGFAGTDSAVSTLEELVEQFKDTTITVAYTVNAAGQIDVAYILDTGWQYSLTLNLSDAMYNAGWRFVDAEGELVKSLKYIDDAAVAHSAAMAYTLHNVNVDMVADTNYVSYFTVSDNFAGGSAVTAATLDAGNLSVTIDPYNVALGARDVVVDIDMKDTTVQFQVTGGLTDVTVEPATTDIMFGEYVDVTVTITGARNEGSKYDLSFVSQWGDASYDLSATIQTKVENNNPVEYTVRLYPAVAGIFTLQAPVLSTMQG